MSSLEATLLASSLSEAVQHPDSGISPFGPSHNFIVTPITSWPCSFNNAATTDESTPPLIATKILTVFPLQLS